MAEQAGAQDFPDDTLETAEPAGELDEEPEIGDTELMALANRHAAQARLRVHCDGRGADGVVRVPGDALRQSSTNRRPC